MNKKPGPDAAAPVGAAPATPLLIVTGMTLDAERAARAMAYSVREHIAAWLDLETDGSGDPPFEPVVCTDIHWLNSSDARECPTIAIGGPGQNALTAYLADKVPSVFTMDGRVLVQMDLDGIDLLAACWGVDDATTATAVERFLEGYLDRFMESACARFEAARG